MITRKERHTIAGKKIKEGDVVVYHTKGTPRNHTTVGFVTRFYKMNDGNYGFEAKTEPNNPLSNCYSQPITSVSEIFKFRTIKEAIQFANNRYNEET